MKNLMCLFFSVLWLAACAHVEVADENTYGAPKKGYGLVYFYRESHFVGGANRYNIWDGTSPSVIKLGSLKSGSYFYIYARPGRHKFIVNGETQGSADFTVEAGKTYYVQNRIDMGFWTARPKLTEVTANEGEKQIHDPDMEMTVLREN